MTRNELAHVVAYALRHGYLDVSLSIDQAVSLLATLDYAEDLIHDLQWVLIPIGPQEVWLCPDCKAHRINGHHDDCGLDAILCRIEGRVDA